MLSKGVRLDTTKMGGMSRWVIEGGKEYEGGADGEVGARLAGDSVIIMPGVDSRGG